MRITPRSRGNFIIILAVVRKYYVVGFLVVIYFCLLVINTNFRGLFAADESVYSLGAMNLMSGKLDPNVHPLLVKTFIAIAASVGHIIFAFDTPLMWRIVSIVFSILILVTYNYVAQVYLERKLRLVSLAILALDPMYFSFSRIINLDIPALFFSLLAFLLLTYYLRERKPRYFLIASLLLGLSLACKMSAGLLVISLPFYFLLKKHIHFNLFVGYFFVVLGGFLLGNIAFFFVKSDISIFTYFYSMTQAQLELPRVVSDFQSSPAWSWFTIPQILTLLRVEHSSMVEEIVAFQNPLIFILTIPAVVISFIKLNVASGLSIYKKSIIELLLLYFGGMYVLWLTGIHATYYYYVIPLLPLAVLLVFSLISESRHAVLMAIFLLCGSVIIFSVYYPMLIGRIIPSSREKVLFSYSKYNYPPTDTLFCQKCSPRK